MLGSDFTFAAFAAASAAERRALQSQLAQHLSEMMQQTSHRVQAMQPPPSPDALEAMRHAAVKQAINQLKTWGHDLWSWDEEEDFERWGPDYTNSTKFFGIVVTLDFPDAVEVDWQEEKPSDT